jgi:hypothetical protein
MKKTSQMAKSKVISKKRASKMPVAKSKEVVMDEDTLKTQLGANLGSVQPTRKKRNPFMATSTDGKNIAYGQTKAEAMHNLLSGITNRPI